MRAVTKGLAAGALAMTAPAFAADTVSASDPAGVAAAMREAGYPAELTTDPYGDPLIKTAFGDYTGSVYFYGCDPAGHDNCDSIQFRAGLDRETPLPLDRLNSILKKYRFTAMWLDDEGDPWVNFDLFTGAGISGAVFHGALKAFRGNFGAVADEVFQPE